MIPKVIHYCWFSGEKPNRFIRNCIKTWQKVMPDYRIRIWDANSFDFDSVPFVRDAFKAKKWAFVADYIRIYALYTEGGIYLDSDVKVYRTFDDFLNNRFFIGTEPLAEGKVELESAIMGSEAEHPYLKECLDFYSNFKFETVDWNNCKFICPRIMSKVMESRGYSYENKEHDLSDGIKIFDRSIFGHCFGTPIGDYYAIHYFNASWLEQKHGFFYRFCKSNDMMDLYLAIEKIVRNIRI